PRARRVTVPLFILFHLGLGLDVHKRYLNFSSVMFALLLLYLPEGAMGRLHDLFADRAAAFRRTFTLVYLALIATSLIAGMNSPLYWIGRWLLWVPYAVGLLIAVVLACALAPRDSRTETVGAGAGLAWAVPVLVMLNGLCPILGLKTRTSWQMYSNIRLEADASNHLLVPRSLDLLGALRDRVVIISTTDENPNGRRGQGTRRAVDRVPAAHARAAGGGGHLRAGRRATRGGAGGRRPGAVTPSADPRAQARVLRAARVARGGEVRVVSRSPVPARQRARSRPGRPR